MLSDRVLGELVQAGPLQRALVSAAWPSLSTESRLQVIAAIQGEGVLRHTPDWHSPD